MTDLAPGQITRFQTHFAASGVPATFELVAKSIPAELNPDLPPKLATVVVYSSPQGADLKVDGRAEGLTPRTIRVPAGKHLLEFTIAGFTNGTLTVEITPQDLTSRSVRFDLERSQLDTVVLRNGTVLTGNVESMTQTDVVIAVGGLKQTLDRKQVRRIILAADELAGK